MIIAFHNFKGGVGTTTLVAHTCALARACGLSVVAMSVDFKQELPRWLAGLQIDCVELDLQHGQANADLLVLDVQAHAAPPPIADVWVVPICDRMSNESAADVSDRLRGHLIWLGNMGRQPIVPAALIDQVELALPMPYSRALAQAAGDQTILWEVIELAESAGARSLRASLLDVLRRAYCAVGQALPPGLASASPLVTGEHGVVVPEAEMATPPPSIDRAAN